MDAGLGEGSFAALAQAFAERVGELKRFTYLRVEDSARGMFQQDLQGLEASVLALEQHVSDLKQLTDRERAALPKVESLIKASKVQGEHLLAISSNLPARLPGPTASSVTGVVARGPPDANDGQPAPSQRAASFSTLVHAASAPLSARNADVAKVRKEVPRAYITERELASLSSYMRGRLTLDKANAALDELIQHAEDNARLIQAARAGGSKLAPAERKRATDLLHSIASKDGIKGNFWFQELDLKEGQLVKMDNSSKVLLTVFRHLGRLQEVRINVEGNMTCVYVFVHTSSSSTALDST